MDNCPYKGLVPYTEEDARYFFGRDTERRIIADNLRATRLTVFYGPSAVGKSSVLNAGVAHDLEHDPDYSLLVFREWHGDPALGLNLALMARLGVPPEHPELSPNVIDSTFLKSMERYADRVAKGEAADRTLVVVLDQFEEYFQYHAKDDRESGFAQQLSQVLNREELPVHFLISIREDSLAALDRFKAEVPTLWDNRLAIAPLSVEAARDAIVRPLRTFNDDLQAGRIAAAERTLHAVEIDEQLAGWVVSDIVRAQGTEQSGVQAPLLAAGDDTLVGTRDREGFPHHVPRYPTRAGRCENHRGALLGRHSRCAQPRGEGTRCRGFFSHGHADRAQDRPNSLRAGGEHRHRRKGAPENIGRTAG